MSNVAITKQILRQLDGLIITKEQAASIKAKVESCIESDLKDEIFICTGCGQEFKGPPDNHACPF